MRQRLVHAVAFLAPAFGFLYCGGGGESTKTLNELGAAGNFGLCSATNDGTNNDTSFLLPATPTYCSSLRSRLGK